MRKILLLLFCLLLLPLTAMSAEYNAEDKVSSIGKTLLSKNGISVSTIEFKVITGSPDNSAFASDRIISISKEELSYAKNDNETAAIVANELGHIILGHASKNRVITSMSGQTSSSTIIESYAQLKSEKEADVIAVNLMANAGYNPLAAIVVLTRQTQTAWNAILGRPVNADRAMNIYDYTSYAYPAKLKAGYNCNEYKNFLTYANTVLEERKQNKKLQAKIEKELKKYRKNSVNKISKFRINGGVSGWDAVYEFLK